MIKISKIPFLKKIANLCKRAILALEENITESESKDQVSSRKVASYAPEKQKLLETMCEKLFSQKELIATGKVQFLGLKKVKSRLGGTWEGFKPKVFQIVEEAITKYTTPADIFIRYKDDTYVVLFANANAAETQVKITLIGEEIRRKLFAHEEQELRNLQVEETFSIIKTQNLKKVKDLPSIMDHVVSGSEKFDGDTIDFVDQPITIEPTFEIDPFGTKSSVQNKVAEESINCTYVPLWDVKKNMLSTYLCLAQDKNPPSGDPFDNYEAFFAGRPYSEKSAMDIRLLRKVKQEIKESVNSGRLLYIICPVHYDTLRRIDSYQQYIVECQQIPDLHKQFLIFLVSGIPETINDVNIEKFLGALKKHCYGLYVQVPLDYRVDFYLLSRWHFSAVGVRLKKLKGSEKNVILKLGEFSKAAKSALIPNVFALDVPSLSITTSAVCADFDFLGGNAIHECVPRPNTMFRFKYQDLFADFGNR